MQSQLETAALEDLIQIEADLERRAEGLSSDFERDFTETVALLLEFPAIGRTSARVDVRRFNLNRFAYHLIYRVEADNLVIYAIAPHRRDPDFWSSRFPS